MCLNDLWRGILVFVLNLYDSFGISVHRNMKKMVSEVKSNQEHVVSTWLLEHRSQRQKKQKEKELQICYEHILKMYTNKVNKEVEIAKKQVSDYFGLGQHLHSWECEQLEEIHKAGIPK